MSASHCRKDEQTYVKTLRQVALLMVDGLGLENFWRRCVVREDRVPESSGASRAACNRATASPSLRALCTDARLPLSLQRPSDDLFSAVLSFVLPLLYP